MTRKLGRHLPVSSGERKRGPRRARRGCQNVVMYCNNHEGANVLKAKRKNSPEERMITVLKSQVIGVQNLPLDFLLYWRKENSMRFGRFELNSCFNFFSVLIIYFSLTQFSLPTGKYVLNVPEWLSYVHTYGIMIIIGHTWGAIRHLHLEW